MAIKAVSLPIEKVGIGALKWARKYCPSFITITIKAAAKEGPKGKILYYLAEYQFSDECDAMLFAVRWQ